MANKTIKTVLAKLSILSATLVGGCAVLPAGLTASLGGNTAGSRGSVHVLFINNTPYRAVFTYGTFDQSDQFSQPVFRQFGLANTDPNLDGNAESSIDPADGQSPLTCARVFGIGSPELLRLIAENLPDAPLIGEAFANGVEFFEVSADGSDDGVMEPRRIGVAPPFEALLGVDFPCGALLIIRFEVNDVGPDPFRIDFELIPSSSDR